MRDADDNTDNLDSINGMTVAQIKPRRIPEMHDHDWNDESIA